MSAKAKKINAHKTAPSETQSTKEKLLAAGVKLIEANGFNKISVEAIAKEAGVAKGSFYTYFKRKEDLVQEINRNATAKIMDEVKAFDDMDLEEKLQLYVIRYVSNVQANDIQICRQWLCNMVNSPEIVEAKDQDKLERDAKALRSLLKEEISAGNLRKKTPIAMVANLLLCQIYGMLTCWCISNGKFLPTDWVKDFCEAQIHPILKPYLK